MPKRSLILAGGGLKVGFQAGVLEVWLDEAGIEFDHADGASGGCFNLAMYCQGMSGKQIADNWRELDPFLPIDLQWEDAWRFMHARSVFTYDRFREHVIPRWGLDWDAVRRGTRRGTFNVFNFSKKRLDVITNDRVTEDHFIASVSLPMWFPPVLIDGDVCIDAVYVTDANLEEAIRRGADELWVIWTVSERDEWRDGFVAQYFQIIETTANAQFMAICRRIEVNNQRIDAGGDGEFGRRIDLRVLRAEVPVHYLFNFSRDRMEEAVNLGVQAGRSWCLAQGIPAGSGPAVPAPRARPTTTTLRFTERMTGWAAHETDPARGHAAGKRSGTPLEMALTIRMDDVDWFVTDPRHEARIEGTVTSSLLGGVRPVAAGVFQLLVHEADPRRKEMRYRMSCTDADGRPLTIAGVKHVESDEGLDAWDDTTTLFVRVLEGDVVAVADATASVRAAGIVRIHPLELLQQLTTFRTEGPTPEARLDALRRFGLLFMGKLWDVYGHPAARAAVAL